jgi:hypothetical protein
MDGMGILSVSRLIAYYKYKLVVLIMPPIVLSGGINDIQGDLDDLVT